HDIATGPNIAGREESGVDVLVTIFAALPDEGRPAAVEERDAGALVIAERGSIYLKGRQDPGETGIQALSADGQAGAAGDVVFPDHITAIGAQGDVRMDLIPGLAGSNRVFNTVGQE